MINEKFLLRIIIWIIQIRLDSLCDWSYNLIILQLTKKIYLINLIEVMFFLCFFIPQYYRTNWFIGNSLLDYSKIRFKKFKIEIIWKKLFIWLTNNIKLFFPIYIYYTFINLDYMPPIIQVLVYIFYNLS